MFSSFSVDELIELQIRCDVVWSESSTVLLFQSPQSQDREKLEKRLEESMITMSLRLESLTMTETTSYLHLRCKGKMMYASFVETNGSFIDISKALYFDTPRSVLRLSVYIDTNFVNDSVTGQGMIFPPRHLYFKMSDQCLFFHSSLEHVTYHIYIFVSHIVEILFQRSFFQHQYI
jgi:hypothetical protein